jgi:hypothetical protein
MVHESRSNADLLRAAREAESELIEAETRAERVLTIAEARYRRAVEKLKRAQARAEETRREFEQARAQLDQCQLERAAGPVIRRVAVQRPALPRPARDDSRGRNAAVKRNEPAPEDAGSKDSDS